MSTKNCKDCFLIQATLDVANMPQADSSALPEAYLTSLTPGAIKNIREILSNKGV